MRRSRFFCKRSHSTPKRSQKRNFRKLTIFGNIKQVIQDYDTVFDNTIPFRKNGLRISEYRACRACTSCLGTEAAGVSVPPPRSLGRVDEYNLNVVDCNASVTVTVARRSSMSVSGGLRVCQWGVPPGPAAGGTAANVPVKDNGFPWPAPVCVFYYCRTYYKAVRVWDP